MPGEVRHRVQPELIVKDQIPLVHRFTGSTGLTQHLPCGFLRAVPLVGEWPTPMTIGRVHAGRGDLWILHLTAAHSP